MPAPPNVGWVRLSSVDPPVSLVVRLSETRPNVEQGFGGWNEVARPRKRPLTTWTGKPGLHLTLGLLLDGFRERPSRSVERQITSLQLLGSPSSGAGEPPIVKILATGSAVPYQDRQWVVNDLQFGDALMNRDGDRTRQEVTLSLVEHVEDVYLAQKAAATLRRQKHASSKKRQGAAEKRVTAHRAPRKKKKAGRAGEQGEFGEGESLAAIAARELGDADRWVEIAALNGLRDPRAVTPGQVIRLP